LDEFKVVGMPCTEWGYCCTPYLHLVLELVAGALLQVGKFVSNLKYIREAKNSGKSFIYQVQTLFQGINVFLKTTNPFPGVIFK
jgi:hypothetical protein